MKRIHTLGSKTWVKIGSMCAVLGVTAILGVILQADHASAATVSFQLNASEENLEMSMSDSEISLDITADKLGKLVSKDLSITVGTNSQYGYLLKMTVPNGGILERIEGDLDNGETPTINPFPDRTDVGGEQVDIPPSGWSEEAIESYNRLKNRWGYKCTTCIKDGVDASTTGYLPADGSNSMLASTNANANANTTELSFGAIADYYTPAGTYNTTIVFTAVVNNPGTISSINQLEYMQDFKVLGTTYPDQLAIVKENMVEGKQYSLKDMRDHKSYYIAKLKDGNVWMTQNLDLDIIEGEGYDWDNTDLPDDDEWHPSTYTHATGDTTWNDNANYTPQSYDPGNLCWNGVLDENWETTLDNGTTACIDGSNMNYHIGNYYNWTAAVAMNDSSNYTENNTDVNQSICPAGWMLPKSGTTQTGSGSFLYLKNQLSLTSGTSGNIQNTPVFFPYGGIWGGESLYVGSFGDYWSSVVYGSDYSYGLYFVVDGSLNPRYHRRRDYGYSVRCVAR